MCAIEYEVRLQIMVEHPLVPIHRVVAQHAPFAKTLVMRIVIAVAGNALLGRITEDSRIVALSAVNISVFAK